LDEVQAAAGGGGRDSDFANADIVEAGISGRGIKGNQSDSKMTAKKQKQKNAYHTQQ
jgi:hypothetical protein